MREIKFRAWDGEKMHFNVTVSGGHAQHPDTGKEKYDWELMQYTGCKDKNGVEIYEDDLIRVRYEYKATDIHDKNWYSETLYRVALNPIRGLVLIGVRPYGKQELNNQYSIHTTLCGHYDNLCDDHRHQHFDHLAMPEKKESKYSNDFTVVGNIHQNANLLEKQ